jgi:hypothetical protein
MFLLSTSRRATTHSWLSAEERAVTKNYSKGAVEHCHEFVLAAATRTAGCKIVVIVSADNDGSNGPGGLSIPGAPKYLAGKIFMVLLVLHAIIFN